MAYDNNNNYDERRNSEVAFTKKIKAGKRRTYFFDVRETRSSDYFITITESKKRFNDDGYDRHKIFLYKEDFNKFITALSETVDFVKTDLMPDFDFDAFNHDDIEEQEVKILTTPEKVDYPTVVLESTPVVSINDDIAVDDWKM